MYSETSKHFFFIKTSIYTTLLLTQLKSIRRIERKIRKCKTQYKATELHGMQTLQHITSTAKQENLTKLDNKN